MQIGDQAYQRGLGVHAPSLLRFRLAGACTHFSAKIGVDDEVGSLGSVVFQVWSDGEKLFDSGTLTGTSPPLASRRLAARTPRLAAVRRLERR